MTWAFVRDVLLYGLLGIIGFPAIVALVAAIRRDGFRSAWKESMVLVRMLSQLVSKAWMKFVLKGIGVSATMVILGFAAYLFSRLGDATMPMTSRMVGHFGNDLVSWSISAREDWETVQFDLREVSGIRGDRDKGESLKADLGRYDVRMARSLFFYARAIQFSDMGLHNR